MKTNLVSFLVVLILVLFCSHVGAQPELTEETAIRYEQMLLRTPDAGTAFDKVVEWYSTGGGGLDVLEQRWSGAGKEDPGVYLILRGLLAERLRDPGSARRLYTEAREHERYSMAAWKCLARLETGEGRFAEAAKAYESALGVPGLPHAERMELLRSLALVYQRALEPDRAVELWKKAIAEAGDDAGILEEAGEAFLTAAAYDEASEAFTRLMQVSARDPFRKTSARLLLARTAELRGDMENAVKIYEQALEDTSAGSWLNRSVRSSIEELFRRKDDLPGLLAYYERRLAAVPSDDAAMAAAAEVLDDLGRAEEALAKSRAAIALAPSREELRLRLAKRLGALGRNEEAITELKPLAAASGASPNILRALGDLHWQAYKQTGGAEARESAVAAWKRIAPENTQDVSLIVQVADLLATHDLTGEAEEQWKRALEIAPGSADLVERLARLYLERGEQPAAKELVDSVLAGADVEPATYLSISRMQDRLEWKDEARATLETALQKFPADYDLLSAAWRAAADAGDLEAAEKLLPRVWEAAPSNYFAEEVVRRYAFLLQNAQKEEEASARWKERFENPAASSLEVAIYLRLAIHRRDEEAARVALEKLRNSGQAVLAARAAAEVAETFGTADEHVEALKAVAAVEPRMAGESLRAAAQVLASANRYDEALALIRDLISKSPADAALYKLGAQTASQAGQTESAKQLLMEGVRFVEDKSGLRSDLADLLMVQGRLGEARAVLQAAFEQESQEGRRMEIFRRIAEIAAHSGGTHTLLDDLRKRQAQEVGGARYGTYIAQILMLQEDYLGAKAELARSLGRNPDDSTAVRQLRDLADMGGDDRESLRLTARLAEIEPTAENRAEHLVRALRTNDETIVLPLLNGVKEEIVGNPQDWMEVIRMLRTSGFPDEYHELVSRLEARSDDGVISARLAEFDLQNGDYEKAKERLWRFVTRGGFGESLRSIMSNRAVATPSQQIGISHALMPFLKILNDRSNLVRRLMQPSYYSTGRRFISSGNIWHRLPAPSSVGGNQPTREQEDQVGALVILNMIALAERDDAFEGRVEALMEGEGLSRVERFLIWSLLDRKSKVEELRRLQTEQPEGGIEADRIMAVWPAVMGDDPFHALHERVRKANPDYAFHELTQDTQKNLTELQTNESEEVREKLRKDFEAIRVLQVPEVMRVQKQSLLVAVAIELKDFDSAMDLIRELGDSSSGSLAGRPGMPSPADVAVQQCLRLAASAIELNHESARAYFDEFARRCQERRSFPANTLSLYSVRFTFMSGDQPRDLRVGSSRFPVSLYKSAFENPRVRGNQSGGTEAISSWLEKHAFRDKLDEITLGLVYCKWIKGDRDEAIEICRTIHAKSPTAETAALLLEMHEAREEYAAALEFIDEAELQLGEAADIRGLRKLRLLALANRKDEAVALAKKLGQSRLGNAARNGLAQEMEQLGIPKPEHLLARRGNRSIRSSGNAERAVVEQVKQMIEAGKNAEAERIIRQVLGRPFPAYHNFNGVNLRREMVELFDKLGLSETREVELESQLKADPSNIRTALLLAEFEVRRDRATGIKRVQDAVMAQTEPSGDLEYAMRQFLRSNTDGSFDFILTLLKSNPGHPALDGQLVGEFLESANREKMVEAGLILAAMDEAAHSRFFLKDRLMNHDREWRILPRLADACAADGHRAEAIRLLRRTIPPDLRGAQEWAVAAQLARLLLDDGQKAEAASLIRSGLGKRTARTAMHGYGGVFDFFNQAASQGDVRPVTDFMDICKEAGVMDDLMGEMEAVSSGLQASVPRLLVLTFLKKPEALGEWKKAIPELRMLGRSPLTLITMLIRPIAEIKGGEDAIESLLLMSAEGWLPFNSHSDFGLQTLRRLPEFQEYVSSENLEIIVNKLIDMQLGEPHSLSHLMHYENYIPALETLLDYGFGKQAKRIFESTASHRRQGMDDRLRLMEAQIKAVTEGTGNVEYVCVPEAVGTRKLRVYWQAQLRIETMGSGVRESRFLTSRPAPVEKESLPVRLEVYAGRNPSTLKKAADVRNPSSSGMVEMNVEDRIGLVQAAVVHKDGTRATGPLMVYVLGENLLKDIKGLSPKEFTTGRKGPMGIPATAYSFTEVHQERSVPLLEFTPGQDPEMYLLTGWLKDGNRGSQVVVEEAGTGPKNRHQFYFSSGAPRQWSGVSVLLANKEGMPGAHKIANSGTTRISLQLRANSYGSSMGFQGEWAGFSFFRLPAELFPQSQSNILDSYHKARREKRYEDAVGAFREAFRNDPHQAVSMDAKELIDLHRSAGKLEGLFAMFSNPALYVRDPLRSDKIVMDGYPLISALAFEAAAPNAPKEAAEWIAVMEAAPLAERLRFHFDASLLAARVDAGYKPSAAEILDLLGFGEGKVYEERIQRLWSAHSDSPLSLLLDALEKAQDPAVTLEWLRTHPVKPQLLAAQRLLESWLTARIDGKAALDLWSESLALRKANVNQSSINDRSDKAVIQRLMFSSLAPDAMMPAVHGFLERRRSNPSMQTRELAEMLYSGSRGEHVHVEEYAKRWAEVELGVLQMKDYSPPRERVRNLAAYFERHEDWAKLELLGEIAKTHRVFNDSTLRNQMDVLEKRRKLATGDLSEVWPVAWQMASSSSGKTILKAAWNYRFGAADEPSREHAVAVPDKPLMSEVPGLVAVEFQFGEMPEELETVAVVEGSAETTEAAVDLRRPNGFLRAVAVLKDGTRLEGPLCPVVSGRRVYPDGALDRMLAGGARPIDSTLVREDGVAPDGSTAYEIGGTDRQRISFEGSLCPVTPGKVYVARAWLRRAGSGAASMGTQYQAMEMPGRKDLNMILAGGTEVTGQWVLYSRIVPVLPKFTFWLDYEKTREVQPICTVEPGTRIAGWELLEVEDWKYGEGIKELAELAKSDDEPVEEPAVIRALALASIEPLSSLDYHGRWMHKRLVESGRPEEALVLYDKAFSSVANPLFPLPKYWRLYSEFMTYIEGLDPASELRLRAAERAAGLKSRAGYPAFLKMQRLWIDAMHAHGRRKEAVEAVTGRLPWDDSQELRKFLRETVGTDHLVEELPLSELTLLISSADDPELVNEIGKHLAGDAGAGCSSWSRIYGRLSMEAALSTFSISEQWKEDLDKASKLAAKARTLQSGNYWTHVIAQQLETKPDLAELARELRERAFERAIAGKKMDVAELREMIRATQLVAVSRLGVKDDDGVRKAAAQLAERMKEAKFEYGESSLKLLLPLLDNLVSVGAVTERDALVSLVSKEVAANEKLKESYAAHLPETESRADGQSVPEKE